MENKELPKIEKVSKYIWKIEKTGEMLIPIFIYASEKLIEQIKQIAQKTGMDRLIIVPRPNMDTPVALTAWTKLLKLDKANSEKIIGFVTEFRNKGPEKTME